MTKFSSFGTDDLPLDVLWEDGERIFCRTWRVDASGERKELMAARSAAEGPASATIARLTQELCSTIFCRRESFCCRSDESHACR